MIPPRDFQLIARTAVLMAILTAPAAAKQPIVGQAIVVHGDAYAGGTVSQILNVAVNDVGEWMVHARLAGVPVAQDQVLIRNGVVVARKGDAVATPSGGTLQVIDSFGINSLGSDARLYKLAGTAGAPFDDFAILVDDVLTVQEGWLTQLPEFSPGTTFGNFFDIKFNDRGEVLLNGFMNDPQVPGTTEAILRLNDLAGSSRTLAKQGDILPGNPGRPVAFFANQAEDTAFNNHGAALFIAHLTGDPGSAQAVYLVDDTLGTLLVAQAGDPAPGGSVYEKFAQSGLGVTDQLGYAFQASRQDDVSILVTHEGLFIAEGDPLPGKPGAVLHDLGTFAPVEIDNSGRVLWIARWGLQGPSGLFLDHQLVVEESVTTVSGLTVTTLDTGSNAYHMSSNGEWIIAHGFTAPGGKPTAFLLQVPPEVCQADLGYGGPGDAIASFCGGDLSTGTTADLLLTGALPLAPAVLILGLTANPTPFKGGHVVPLPILATASLFTDGAGEISLPDVSGGGGPVSVVLQFAIVDASQPAGVAFSNAIRADFLP